jgi:hypothetical protein
MSGQVCSTEMEINSLSTRKAAASLTIIDGTGQCGAKFFSLEKLCNLQTESRKC